MLAEVEARDANAFITVEQPREIRWGWMPAAPRQRFLPSVPFDWLRRAQR